MDLNNIPSKLLDDAVHAFSSLPGIGKKTALRMVLFLLKQEKTDVLQFAHSLINLAEEIKYCSVCHNISDQEVCSICSDPKRDKNTACVVESIKDVMAIESTQQFHGLYHVLGGVISPMDGLGPSDLEIESLVKRVERNEIKEVILALSTTMEGDTTNFYIYRKLNKYPVKITTLARGVSIGDEIEYADEITLGRSILNRTLFENSYSSNED